MKLVYLITLSVTLSQPLCLSSDFVHLKGEKIREFLAKTVALDSGKIPKADVKRIFKITSFGEIVSFDRDTKEYQTKIDDNYNLSISFWQSSDNLAYLAIVDLKATQKSGRTTYLPLRWNPTAGSYFRLTKMQ